jgi:RimJ/RimL family protein N-acetyltransferase
LRHFVRGDAPLIMTLNAETSTRRWLPSHVYATVDDAMSALEFLISSYSVPGDPQLGPYVLAIEHRDTARLLGHVGFSPLGSEVEVSYAIAESARGRGYGAESLVHACRWIVKAFPVSRIMAVTASGNVASRRTLERASFVHAQDEEVVFQGVQQGVSRYCWNAPVNRSGA